jgi:hypothetical protein
MAVDNDFAEVFLRFQKFIPDPQQIFFVLLGERNARSNPRMNKKIIATFKPRLQPIQKFNMRGGHRFVETGRERLKLFFGGIEWRHDAVGLQRIEATVLAPMFEKFGIAEEIEQEHFMVAFQADHLMGLAALDQALENQTRVGASIDVVSEEDLDGPLHRKARKVLVDMEQQPIKQIRPAVQIANSVDANTVRKAASGDGANHFANLYSPAICSFAEPTAVAAAPAPFAKVMSKHPLPWKVVRRRAMEYTREPAAVNTQTQRLDVELNANRCEPNCSRLRSCRPYTMRLRSQKYPD